ncbi:MAG: hypothetical protein MI974_12900 [Chitinophagales bacterium]|nr:hypothetical protein [Chitinophagales bacterium]
MNATDLLQRGFNAGYKMSQLDSELTTHFQHCLQPQDTPYAKGFHAGVQQFEKERTASYSPTLPPQKSTDLSKDKGKEIDL